MKQKKSKAGLFLFILLTLGCSSASNTWEEGKPKHHTENGFRNYPVVLNPPPIRSGFYLRRFLGSFFLPDVPADHVFPEQDAIKQFHELAGEETITWLGQSTFLIRIGGKTILTDPYLTEYAGPFWILGPRRFTPPGISIDNLPPIDIIVVSHNHLDHLDAETVESIKNKENIQVYVPLGMKRFFTERDYKHVEEWDWNERRAFGSLQFTALPTVHHSGRSIGDKDEVLWCSWAITSPGARLYFIGDSGYSPTIFKKIGEQHGPFDAALVTIGAYETRQGSPITHLYPYEAIQVGLELNAKAIVGMHWGSLELSDEPHFEPPVRFKKAAKKAGISEDRAWVMKIGETRKWTSSYAKSDYNPGSFKMD